MAEPTSPLRILARSASSLAVLHAASMGIAFLIGIMLARLLGASGYGIYGLAMSVATVTGMVAEFGLPALTMREVGAAKATGRWDLVRGLHNWSLRIVLLISAVLLAGLFVYNQLTGLSAGSPFMAAMLWAALLIPIVALGKLKGVSLLALGRTIAGEFPVLVLRPGLFLLALTAVWLGGRRIEAPLAMALQVAAALVALLVVWAAWGRYRPAEMRSTPPAHALRQWLGAAIPLGVADGLRALQGHFAVLTLGLLATAGEVGIFRVADSVGVVLSVGQSALVMATLPLIAKLHAAGERAELQRVIGVVAVGMAASTLFLGLPFLVLGKQLLHFLFGAEFEASFASLLIIWAAYLVSALFGPAQGYAAMAHRQGLLGLGFLISVVVGVLVSLVAIPALGAAGAAVGILVAQAASNLWLWNEIRTRDGINTALFAPGMLRLISTLDARGLRQRIAAGTPAPLRKIVRCVEHYLRRQREWFHVLRETRGASFRDGFWLYASALCAPVAALSELDGFRPPRLLRDLELATRAGRFRVRAGTDDIIHVLRAREPHVWRTIESRLPQGGVFIDAGANIGFYSALAHRLVGPSGRVVAVEMVPATAAILRTHMALNGGAEVTIVEKALADTDGAEVVAMIPAGKFFGRASIAPNEEEDFEFLELRQQTVTLDTALRGLPAIDLIKMDLEGAEYLALCGAKAVLARTNAVLFENNTRDPRIFALLNGAGFAIEAIGNHDYLASR